MSQTNRIAIWSLISTFVTFTVLASADAGVRPPESLLSQECAVYLRFDGIAPHRAAFDRTILGQLLMDELQPLTKDVGRRILDAFGVDYIAERLLAGVQPRELLELQSDSKRLPDLLAFLYDHGALIGVEVLLKPQAAGRFTIVFPNVADEKSRAAISGGMRLLARMLDVESRQIQKNGRAVVRFEEDGYVFACWQEDRHVIWAIGPDAFEQTLAVVQGKRPNLAQDETFQRLVQFNSYETYARGFIQAKPVLQLLRQDDDEFDSYITAYGLDGLTNAEFQLGFAGTHLRQSLILKTKGERKGLLQQFSGIANVDIEHLPPLPSDAVSVDVHETDVGSFLTGFSRGFELLLLMFEADPEEIRTMVTTFEESIGAEMRRTFLNSLGRKVVTYNCPSEGPLFLGTAMAFEVTDEKKLKTTFNRLAKAFGDTVEEAGSIRTRSYRGVNLHMFEIDTDSFPIVPTCAVHDGWLVIGLSPQVVKGFVLRSTRNRDVWTPAPLVSKTFQAGMQALGDRERITMIGQSNPKLAAKLLLSILPLYVAMLRESPASADSFDLSLIPTTEAVTELLSESVSMTVDDGRSIRFESYSPLPLPLNLSGVEVLYFYFGLIFLEEIGF